MLRADRARLRLEPRGGMRSHRPTAMAATGFSTAKRPGSPMARLADVAVVLGARREGIRGFLVENGHQPGTTRDIHGKLSMRASVTSSLASPIARVHGNATAFRRKGLKCRSWLPDAGTLRHRLGRHRRGHGLLRNGAQLFTVPRKQFDDRPIAATNWFRKSWPDDHRNHQGAIARHCKQAGSRIRQSGSRRMFPC